MSVIMIMHCTYDGCDLMEEQVCLEGGSRGHSLIPHVTENYFFQVPGSIPSETSCLGCNQAVGVVAHYWTHG